MLIMPASTGRRQLTLIDVEQNVAAPYDHALDGQVLADALGFAHLVVHLLLRSFRVGVVSALGLDGHISG